ncbi:unnamed protein product [Cunninghamella blakesleeana]
MNPLTKSLWTKLSSRPIIQISKFHSSIISMGPKVVVTRRLLPDSQKRLEEQKGFDLYQWANDDTMPREQLLKDIKGADALICTLSDNIDKEVLEAAGPQLKLVSTMSVGFDHIDIKAARAKDIKIGYTPDVLTDATADIAALLALNAARHVKPGIHAVQNGGWTSWKPAWLCGQQFTNKTLGVVGFGRIGQAAAERLKGFGIGRTIYWGRTKKEGVDAELVPFDQLLQESDFVIVCCSLTPDTKEIFNYDAFKKMKKSAVFVNISRGGIVKQDDLARALEENEIYSAGLDVTVVEPLPLDDKLQSLDNCIVLPHIGSATIETRELMSNMMIDNVVAFVENKAIPFELKK